MCYFPCYFPIFPSYSLYAVSPSLAKAFFLCVLAYFNILCYNIDARDSKILYINRGLKQMVSYVLIMAVLMVCPLVLGQMFERTKRKRREKMIMEKWFEEDEFLDYEDG